LFICSNWFYFSGILLIELLNITVNNDLLGISKQIQSGFD